MTEREVWETVIDLLNAVFLAAFVLEERYGWRDKLVEKLAEYRRRRRSERLADLWAHFEGWTAATRDEEVRLLEDIWARR